MTGAGSGGGWRVESGGVGEGLRVDRGKGKG